jgi:hypothetical protein
VVPLTAFHSRRCHCDAGQFGGVRVREILDLKFALMPRPRGGEWLAEEILGWYAEGIRTVVSLLERDEAIELGLRDEEALCNSAGVNFISHPIPDRGVPGVRAGFSELVNFLGERLRGRALSRRHWSIGAGGRLCPGTIGRGAGSGVCDVESWARGNGS